MCRWKCTAGQTASEEQESQRFGPKPFVRTREVEGSPEINDGDGAGGKVGHQKEQRDLEMFIHRSLKLAGDVNGILKKAYGMLTIVSCGIVYKSREVRSLYAGHLPAPDITDHLIDTSTLGYRNRGKNKGVLAQGAMAMLWSSCFHMLQHREIDPGYFQNGQELDILLAQVRLELHTGLIKLQQA
eukprot:g46607.t1